MEKKINATPLRMLRRPEVEARTGLKRSTIYENIANGTFPRPVRLGSRITCWLEHEIDGWLHEQVRKSRGVIQ